MYFENESKTWFILLKLSMKELWYLKNTLRLSMYCQKDKNKYKTNLMYYFVILCHTFKVGSTAWKGWTLNGAFSQDMFVCSAATDRCSDRSNYSNCLHEAWVSPDIPWNFAGGLGFEPSTPALQPILLTQQQRWASNCFETQVAKHEIHESQLSFFSFTALTCWLCRSRRKL